MLSDSLMCAVSDDLREHEAREAAAQRAYELEERFAQHIDGEYDTKVKKIIEEITKLRNDIRDDFHSAIGNQDETTYYDQQLTACIKLFKEG